MKMAHLPAPLVVAGVLVFLLVFGAYADTMDTEEDLHLLFMFTNVDHKASLQKKFSICIQSLFEHLDLPEGKRLNIHFIADEKSKVYGENLLAKYRQPNVRFVFHDKEEIARKIFPIVEEMQKRFSAGKDTYYGDSIFFLSIGMHRVMPPEIERIVQLDFDIMFHTSVHEIFDEFDRFDEDDLIGLGPEMQPVYRHVLWKYRQENLETRAGSPRPEGLPGFNSGAILLDLEGLRKSELYNRLLEPAVVEALAEKYHFKGHLGDQDFFTLLGFEHEELFYKLDCGWNRQLCTWWRDRGYQGKTFTDYHFCDSEPKITHGNCSTPIPGSDRYLPSPQPSPSPPSAPAHGEGATDPPRIPTVRVSSESQSHVTRPAAIQEEGARGRPSPREGAEGGLGEGKGVRAIHLAVVACGDRLPETMVMLKSALLFTQAPLRFHIFADGELRPQFRQQLDAWPEDIRAKFEATLYPISYPGVNAESWVKLFKLCASQRLFIPYLVESTDRLIYVDTDILFLRPLDDLWSFFDEFDRDDFAALAPEHEVEGISWYKRHAHHPYVEPLGVNSGVMLMDLARMREAGWRERMVDYRAEYKAIPWGDQDLINIFFHDSPDRLRGFPCEWNYRPDHCQYGNNCQTAETEGAAIVHGNRRAFHNEKYPVFNYVYDVFEAYELGEDLYSGLVQPLRGALTSESATARNCGKQPEIFAQQLMRQIELREMTGSPQASDPKDTDSAEDELDYYRDIAIAQLDPWREGGITEDNIHRAADNAPYITRYQIIDGRLYRDSKCYIGPRCKGIEHFLLEVASELPDLEFVVNVSDLPRSTVEDPEPVFSFSKIPGRHADILYPAWAFWQGGPWLKVIPSWRWDLVRHDLLAAGRETAWNEKENTAFFRGSRTNSDRDSLIFHALDNPTHWDVRFTRNQSQRATDYVSQVMKLEFADHVSPRDHCRYRYLVNFDGVAASFRLRNILACGATVLYANPTWIEFFYPKLEPWEHYVPLTLDGDESQDVLDFLMTHEDLPERIATNGREFIEQHLTLGHVSRYWLRLLQEYASLQRFEPVLDEDLVLVNEK